MSRNDGGSGERGTARERLRAEREQERHAAKRRRTWKMVGVTVFALGVGGLASVAGVVWTKSGSGTADTKPVVAGHRGAPATLTVYEDFRCPACGQFENQFRDTVNDLRKEGKLRTEYHLVTLIDGNMGGHGSAAAANAALCAEDENRFTRYHDVLYRHQPSEEDDAFAGTRRLLKLAGEVKGLGGSAPFEKCVAHHRNAGRVERSNSAFNDSKYHQTPTVLLDGRNVYGGGKPLTPAGLRRMVEAGK